MSLAHGVKVFVVLLTTTVLLTALPAAAVGPDALLDGIWFVRETGPGIGPPTYYASIHQNGATVVGILISLEGEWIYVVGTRSGSNVQGVVHDVSGSAFGSFNLTITSPTTMTGQSTGFGVTTPLVANKVF